MTPTAMTHHSMFTLAHAGVSTDELAAAVKARIFSFEQ